MSKHPEWATKHRQKGTELRFINGRYYLYAVASKWDPELKRSKKITGSILGKITEENGFVESEITKLRKREQVIKDLTVKEYGVTAFIDNNLNEYEVLLKKHFPEHWQVIIALVYGRLVHHSPMKNMEFHYLQSYLSEKYPELSLSPKNLSRLLREIGTQRDKIRAFFKEFITDGDNIIFDGTDLLTNSKKMEIPKLSKTKKGTFDSVANIMFAFSVNLQLPTYYRILSGNIKDITAFKLCIEESQINDAVIITDKGFYSKSNIEKLRAAELKFIIPLRRNNKQIVYDVINSADKEQFDNYFIFEKRIIWHYTINVADEKIVVYLDDAMKTEEIKDYLTRIVSLPEKYNITTFHEKQHAFGTIAIQHNMDKTAEEIFIDYKSRGQVETMINVFKNVIDADKSYMQNEQALEAWMFVNHIALHWYYKIIQLIKKNELNSKYSPNDLLQLLKEVRKVRINGKWHNENITQKNLTLIKALNIHIT